MTQVYDTSCSICLDDLENETTSLSCGHSFHIDCIIKALRKSNECPNCRDTAGNPTSKVSSSNQDNIFGIDYESDYFDDQELIDYLKSHKDLKQAIRDFNRKRRDFSKSANKMANQINRQIREVVSNEKQKIRETCPQYKTYLEERKAFHREKQCLKKKMKKIIRDELEPDEENDDDTLDIYLTGNLWLNDFVLTKHGGNFDYLY